MITIFACIQNYNKNSFPVYLQMLVSYHFQVYNLDLQALPPQFFLLYFVEFHIKYQIVVRMGEILRIKLITCKNNCGEKKEIIFSHFYPRK